MGFVTSYERYVLMKRNRNITSEITLILSIFTGTGYSQALGAFYVLSYYMSIIALCLYYLAMSFSSTLPWAICRPEWENCVPSVGADPDADTANGVSSAELYFTLVI